MVNSWTNSTSFQPRIMVVGLPWIEEFIAVSESTRLFSTLKLLDFHQIVSRGWSEIITTAEDCDYLILRGDAYKLILELNSLNLLQRFNKLRCSKIFWSLDSHMLHELEQQVIQYFDYFCVAHSEWINFLTSSAKLSITKILHIPCSFNLVSTRVLKSSLSEQKKNSKYDIFFPYVFYDESRRNILAFEVFHALKKMNVKFAFGRVTGYSNFLPEKSLLFHCLRSSKVVLNLSIAGELNKRIFEAYYARSAIVSNQSVDLEKFPEISRGALLFDQKSASGELIAEMAREAARNTIYPEVEKLIENTDLNRILQIVESVSGLNLGGSVEEYVAHIDCEVTDSKLVQVIYGEDDLAIQWFKAMRKYSFLKFIFTKSPFFNKLNKIILLMNLPKEKFLKNRHKSALRYYKFRRFLYKEASRKLNH